MTTLITLALVVCSSPAPAPMLVPAQSGTVKVYSPGIMRQVIYNRTTPGRRGYIPGLVIRKDVAGYVSMQDCRTIGRTVWASVNGRAPRLYQQTDCSHPRDVGRHRAQRLILELDWESAQREGIARAGRGWVTIYRWRAQ